MKLSTWQKINLALSLAVLGIFMALLFVSGSSRIFSFININETYVKEASFWEKKDLGVQCTLCPSNCFLQEGTKGLCRVRMNRGNKLYTQVYNQPVSINVDPIEKKPIFHMLPGSTILSISTVGCPLACTFCQNWTISQEYPEKTAAPHLMTPAEIVQLALDNQIPSIAFTYGEPIIYYEYMRDVAQLARQKGLSNVMVTSGYINPKPLLEIAQYFDVVKVDLKGIDQEFYRQEVGGYLDSVLDTLALLKKLNILVEVVNLVVPGRNDSDGDIDKLSKWVREKMGQDTPLFFSRFHPDYKLSNLPATPLQTLEHARDIAIKNGLQFVYLGNVPGHAGENTYCPEDGTLLIERNGYQILQNNLKDGKCPVCGKKIPGFWHKKSYR